MGMNQTPSSERVHIGLFGERNAGKSSVINAVTNQDIAIVSAVRGTTTDPVYKSMELLPLGPVMLIDTPGLDDKGELGALRVQKGLDVLRKTDIALLIVDGTAGMSPEDERLEEELKKYGKQYEFHRYDGAGHGIWYYFNQLYRREQAMDSQEKVFAFLEKHLRT